MTVDTEQDPRDTPTAIAIYDADQAALAQEHILATGDLADLTPKQRVGYYLELCRVLGLNSLSRPFDWLTLDGRLVLYPNKSLAEQLGRRYRISIKITRRDIVGDQFVCVAEGRTPDGRTNEASKYVPLTGWDSRRGVSYRLTGTNLSNAFAKAETGAKRRLVLSMIGLGALPDLDEAGNVRYTVVDGTGQVIDNPTAEQRELAANPSVARVIGAPTFETTATPEDAPIHGDVQAPAAEDLEPTKREVPRQTLRPSKKQVERWVAAWFSIVDGLSLDTDDARHAYVREYTDGRYDSLQAFMEHATAQQAGEFLEKLRADCRQERAELEEILAAPDTDDELLTDGD